MEALPRKFRIRETFTHALDIWSLSCLVHEILTLHKPFFNSDDGSSDDESGVFLDPDQGGPEIDMYSLVGYCKGDIDFPTEILLKSQVGEAGIAFVKSLLTPYPEHRPTATCALQDPWLKGYTSGLFESLRDEFSHLGVDLDFGGKENILIRQVGKADIMGFLPTSAKDRVPSLLLKAVTKGYNSVISKLLESPSHGLEAIDTQTRRKLLRTAAKVGQLDTTKILLHNKIDVNAPPKTDDGQTALQAAAEGGHIDIIRLLLDNKADVNAAAVKYSGRTALQAVAGGWYINIVRLLLDNKADVNAAASEFLVSQLYKR